MPQPYVETTLSFLGAVEGTPINRLDLDPPQPYPSEQHAVRVHDMRPVANELTLDGNGIKLVKHPDGVLADYRDAQAITARYYPALERLVKAETGAVRAVVFDHTFRSSALSREAASKAQPLAAWPTGNIETVVTRTHNDYTPQSGPMRVREMLGKFAPDVDADAAMQHRYAVFNVWRPINGSVEQMPLAMGDMTTLDPADFVPTVNQWKYRTGYVSSLRFRPSQRWYYAPGLAVDEALMFKGFDSAPPTGRWCSAHSAFVDPTTPPNPRVRESIESRIIALWG
jgi:hypothetical protein